MLAGFSGLVGCRCARSPQLVLKQKSLLGVFCQPGWYAGSHNTLWRRFAAQKWPAETLRLDPYYTTYKVSACCCMPKKDQLLGWSVITQELFQDDNKRSACPTIDLASMNKLSAYKYNRPSYFLECHLIALQWDRNAQLVRHALLCSDHVHAQSVRLTHQ